MCFSTPRPPANNVVDPNRAATAASDALVRDRRSAQGFSSTIMGGLLPPPPAASFARQMLLGA